jgi:hypothetical protein
LEEVRRGIILLAVAVSCVHVFFSRSASLLFCTLRLRSSLLLWLESLCTHRYISRLCDLLPKMFTIITIHVLRQATLQG